jgi:ClpP class serine protease
MTVAMPMIAERMFGSPLMIEDRKGAIIARALGPRVLGQSVTISGGEQMGVLSDPVRDAIDGWTGEKVYRGPKLVGDVAVVEIEGTLVNKGSYIGQSSGLTSYEGIGVQVADCHSPAIKAAVFEVDSFGGEVDGAFACAEEIFALGETKPTIAILTDHACSAGYLLAAACRQIVIPSTGYAGSIGVITMHIDATKWMEREGLAVNVLRAGPDKARPQQFVESMGEAEFAERMADIEALRNEFAAAVARFRTGRMSLEAILATNSKIYRGGEAVKIGLCDAVARPAEAFRAFLAEFGATAS